jgi:dihydrofolate synthase/folylpolyglutamate synthase
MTLKDHIAWVESLRRFQPKTSLDRLSTIFKALDLSYDAKKVQVIGTNGKGSTAKMLTDVLKHTITVGTFMSPYVYDFQERFLINGENISDETLIKAFEYIRDVYQTYDDLTFFECLTLMAFYVFKVLKLDVIIMEAGIGGRLDATSIETYDYTLFTSVGHDHLNVLGPTLEDVCRDKVCAVKKNGTLLSTVSKPYQHIILEHINHVDATFYDVSRHEVNVINNYPLTFTYRDDMYTLSYVGAHYARNATLVIEVALLLNMSMDHIKKSLLTSTLYGRFEEVGGVVLDAAHNLEAIEAFTQTLETLYPDIGKYVIFSALGDKDIMSMVERLNQSSTVIVTAIDDVRYKDLSYVQEQGIPFIKRFEDAYEYVMHSKDQDAKVFITGSIHFISQVKSKILNIS